MEKFLINNLMIHLKTLEKHVESYLKKNRSEERNRLIVQIKEIGREGQRNKDRERQNQIISEI